MSEISSKESWETFHTSIYHRLLRALKDNPPQPPAEKFLLESMPLIMRGVYGEEYGYIVKGDTVNYELIKEGDLALFWTGDDLEIQPFDLPAYWVGDYFAVAQRIIEFAATLPGEPLIVDLGAGTCLQAVTLRASDCDFRVLNLDYFRPTIGERIVRGLGLTKMAFGGVDVTGALSDPAKAQELKDIIDKVAGGRPVIVVSRYAIFGFYSEAEYQRLFNLVINDLGAVAGFHIEMCGHKTAAYREMCKMAGNELLVATKAAAGDGDPLTYLEHRPDIEVIERLEVWPHQVITRFPSYIAWRTKANT